MFVQASNLRFYENPVFSGLEWAVMFNDDIPTIAIRDIGKRTNARVKEILVREGFEFSKLGPAGCERSIIDGRMADVCVHAFVLEAPIPIPSIHGAVVDVPLQSSTMIGFETWFETELLVRAIVGMEIDTLLCRAVMKQVYYKKQLEKIRPELAKKLYKQHPFLREFDRKNWEELLKDQPRRVMVKWRTT